MHRPKVYVHRAGDWYEKYMCSEDMELLSSFADVVTESSRTEPMTKAELVERMKGAEVILSINGYGSDEIDNEVLEEVGTVKYIVITHWWGQFTHIDQERLGVKVLEGSNANTVAVAEWVLGAALMGVRKIDAFHNELMAGAQWEWLRYNRSQLIVGKRVGLVGMGRIGRYVARFFNAVGCEVVAYDKYIEEEELTKINVKRVELNELFSTSDVVSLHLPVTPETTKMLGAEHFALIKYGAVFINSARAELYDEEALIVELKKNKFAAYLDVFSQEPLPLDNPLWSLPNVTMNPHIAGTNYHMFYRCVNQSVQTIKKYAETGEMVDHRFLFP